jgi:cytoskeletal protein RodZ
MSNEADGVVEAPLAPVAQGVGPQLRAAREARGLTLAQVATRTKIAERNLMRIEAGAFDELPGRMYAIAFAKTYAKLVGLDQDDVAAMVRGELGDTPEPETTASNFEPGDPARGPSGGLVRFSLFALVMIVIGLFFAGRAWLDPAAELPSLAEQEQAEERAVQSEREAAAAQATAPVDAAAPVVLTAEGNVWLRLSDAQGGRLMEGEMAQGQSFTIPADANAPTLLTGRPDLLAISIGGRAVPKVSDEAVTVSNVPVDAASLLGRAPEATATPTPSPTSAATPASVATPANGNLAGD